MKAYWLTLVMALGTVYGINDRVDVSGLRSTGVTARLARQQHDSDLIASPSQFNHREWVGARLDVIGSQCPDVLVTGSSTVGSFSSEMFHEKMFNAFVAGPMVEDLEALTTILRRSHCVPRAIVVGVDPWWTANPALDDKRWVPWAKELLAYERGSWLRTAELDAIVTWAQFEERLSFATTRESLTVLLDAARGTPTKREVRLIRPEDRDAFCAVAGADYYVRAVDGHFLTCADRLPTPARRDEIAANYAVSNPHAMSEWHELDKSRLERLAALTRAWGATYDRVVLLATPYHPLAFRRLTDHPTIGPNLAKLDEVFRGMQSEHVTYLNLRDPATVPCAGDEFNDSHHVAEACARKIIARLVATIDR